MKETANCHNIIHKIWLPIAIVMSLLAMALGCVLYRVPQEKWLTYGAFSVLGTYLFGVCVKAEKTSSSNAEKAAFHEGRFLLLYFIALAISLFCPKIPAAVWPFSAVYLMLALFSNGLTGIVASAMCTFLSVLLCNNGDVFLFSMYFLSGVGTVVFFRNLDKGFKIGYPVFLSELFLLLCILCFSGYTVSFDFSLILFAAVNLVISFILILLVLKFYSSAVVHRDSDKYLELNDPNSNLMNALKQKNQKEYLKAVHIAYFCDRICTEFHLDPMLTKAAAYHYNMAKCKYAHVNWSNTEKLCTEYEFPEAVCDVLREYWDDTYPMKSVESAILYVSSRVISTILYLFDAKPGETIQYDEMIDSVFRKLQAGGRLAQNDITLAQIETMRGLFKKEKLYYDFLRRE